MHAPVIRAEGSADAEAIRDVTFDFMIKGIGTSEPPGPFGFHEAFHGAALPSSDAVASLGPADSITACEAVA